MGTLEQQTRAYQEALVYFESQRAIPDAISLGDTRQILALINHSTHGAFRLAPTDSKATLGTREKQAWEGLGNIPKTEAMRRLVDKISKLQRDKLACQ